MREIRPGGEGVGVRGSGDLPTGGEQCPQRMRTVEVREGRFDRIGHYRLQP
jgi:hypothetical protein